LNFGKYKEKRLKISKSKAYCGFMGIPNDLGLWWNIIRDPGRYAGKQMGFQSSLKLYYEASIIPISISLVLGVALILFGINAYAPWSSPFVRFGLLAAFIIGLVLMLWVLIPISIFVNAFIYHIVGKYILKAWNKSYEKTFVATLFGTLPQLFLSWLLPIPFINIFALMAIFVWGLIVLIISLSEQQKTSRINAFVTLIASVLLVLVPIMIFVALIGAIITPAASIL
jgi:hypothetical protein